MSAFAINSRTHRLDPGICHSGFFWGRLLLAVPLIVGPAFAAQAQKASPSPISSRTNEKSQRPLGMRFAVQVGAFDSRSAANQMALKAAQIADLPVHISPVKVNGKELFRVRVLARRRAEAEVLAARFRAEGNLQVWVVDLNQP